MRSVRKRRWLAAGVALTFLAGLAGQAVTPHHGHHGASHEADRGASHGGHHPPIHEPSSHHGPGAAPLVSGASELASPCAPDGGPPSPCTCLGVCHGTAATPLPSLAFQLPRHRETLSTRLAARPRTPQRPPLAYLLPYANGPPL